MIALVILLIVALIALAWYSFAARLVLLALWADLRDARARLRDSRTALERETAAVDRLGRLAMQLGATQAEVEFYANQDWVFAEILRIEFPQESA